MSACYRGTPSLSLLSLCLLMACVQNTEAQLPLEQPAVQSILAITNDDYPYRNLAIAKASATAFKLLNLDAVDILEQHLSQHVPADKRPAETTIKQHIAEIGQAQLNQQLRDAYEPIIMAMRYGVDRYPVVIFDGRAVVYGITDLQVALNHYIQWLTAQPGDAADE